MSRIYKEFPDGKVLEIQNWRQASTQDRLLGRYLDEAERDKFKKLRDSGLTDSDIFLAIHPTPRRTARDEAAIPGLPPVARPPTSAVILLPVDQLFKEQILALLQRILTSDLKTLRHASDDDLRALLKGLIKSDSLKIHL
jgi:hypothetical protein